jgi:formylglycine-generating enzyme required for sulfatase activity
LTVIVLASFGCDLCTGPEYENTVAAVAIQPAGGNLEPSTQITLSVSTPEAEIRYTLDGSVPTLHSIKYTSPFVLPGIGRIVVKARGFKEEWNPSPVAKAEFFIPHTPPEMAFVEGGSFFNGITQVDVGSLYMDRTEVTQAEYYAVMQALPAPLKLYTYPVYYVSWLNAVEYCNRRSLLDGYQPCYSFAGYGSDPLDWPADYGSEADQHNLISCDWTADGYRLPTEMEWLFAFIGGNQTHYYEYSGSDKWFEVSWCNGNSGYAVHPVAGLIANELGLHDMSGNLWEWCWDYRQDDKDNAYGKEIKGSGRSLRGGAWNTDPGTCSRFCSASFYPAYELSASIGFRCCRRA